MDTQEKMDSILEELLSMAQSGVTLKNIRRSLSNKGVTGELQDKLVRITELEYECLS